MRKTPRRLCIGLFLVCLLVVGCTLRYGKGGLSRPRGGPPSWAPAHGRRAKEAYCYRYYPSSHVYFDPRRSVYIYFRGGRWCLGAELPGYIEISAGEAVEVMRATARLEKTAPPPGRVARANKGRPRGKKMKKKPPNK